MARYDGLIIPRSYNDYISKSDAATLSQALKLGGVMDGVLGVNGAESLSDLSQLIFTGNKKIDLAAAASFINQKKDKYHNIFIGADTASTETGYYELFDLKYTSFGTSALTLFIMTANYNNRALKPAIVQIVFRYDANGLAIEPRVYLLSAEIVEVLQRIYLAYDTLNAVNSKVYISEPYPSYDPVKINILDFTNRNKQTIEQVLTINENPILIDGIPSNYQIKNVFEMLSTRES